MECHYHPEREATDVCAICGKSICKECGLEIAGKIYCKDCLEKIVGLETANAAEEPAAPIEPEPALSAEPENIYQPQEEYEIPYAQEEPAQEYRVISDDSPYNIKDNVEYGGEMESSYLSEDESIYQQPPEVAQNEYEAPQAPEPDYIYPDHSYEPEPTSARQDLEDRYEKYLDDLYFDETEVPLGEQLAKDEEEYGSLTRREYKPRPVEEAPKKTAQRKQAPKKAAKKQIPKNETPEEMEARIRAEILQEQEQSLKDGHADNIHNLNYQEKEPMGVIDILLTLILIIVILVVLYYVIYLFFLSATYPTFMEAVYALKNPQNVINHLLTSVQK